MRPSSRSHDTVLLCRHHGLITVLRRGDDDDDDDDGAFLDLYWRNRSTPTVSLNNILSKA